jgi:hypothetical protein
MPCPFPRCAAHTCAACQLNVVTEPGSTELSGERNTARTKHTAGIQHVAAQLQVPGSATRPCSGI